MNNEISEDWQSQKNTFFKKDLFIFGCIGSSLVQVGFL